MNPEAIVAGMTPQRLSEAATASTATLAFWYGAEADHAAIRQAVLARLAREPGPSLETLQAEAWVR